MLKQAIHKDGDFYLLNVRKIYTDNVYFGVTYTTFTPSSGILHQFLCKDRPLGDLSVVHNKDRFISSLVDKKQTKKQSDSEWLVFENLVTCRQEKQNFELPYDVYFCFNSGNVYRYTLIDLKNGSSLRGLYSSNNEETYDWLLEEFNGWASRGAPSKELVISFVRDKIKSFSNNIISVSTDYSKIIIEHATQYEQEWSDIKRRRDGS